MRPKNSNSGSEEDGANEQGGEEEMQRPRAASEQQVEDVRSEVEDVSQYIEEVQNGLTQEVTDLRLRVEEQQEQVEKLDRLVNALYRMAATRDGEPPLNSEMPHVVPENREEDAQTGEVMLEVEGEGDE